MEKVIGIGGIFFKAKNPGKIRSWYAEHLGLKVNEYGSVFEFREAESRESAYLQWSPFKHSSDYFPPSEKEFMLNYRVQDLEKLKLELEAGGVEICDEIETYEYGNFYTYWMLKEKNRVMGSE